MTDGPPPPIGYSIDASGLIRAGQWYRQVPSFWEHMRGLVRDGRLWLVEDADAEVKAAKKEEHYDLRPFIDGCEGLVVPVDQATQGAFETHVRQHYVPETFTARRSAADPYVIALAKARGGVVVGEELAKDRSNATKHIKMPTVCARVGFDHLSAWEIPVREGWNL